MSLYLSGTVQGLLLLGTLLKRFFLKSCHALPLVTRFNCAKLVSYTEALHFGIPNHNSTNFVVGKIILKNCGNIILIKKICFFPAYVE